MTDTVSLNDIMLKLCKQRLPAGAIFCHPSALISDDSRALVLKGWSSTSIKPREFIAMSKLLPDDYNITVSDTSRGGVSELKLTGQAQDLLVFVIDFKTALAEYEQQNRKENPTQHTPRTKPAPRELAMPNATITGGNSKKMTWAERMAADMTPQGEALLRKQLSDDSMSAAKRTKALQILKAAEEREGETHKNGAHRS